MKKHDRYNCFLAAGFILNASNIIASRLLPFPVPDAVYFALSIISAGLIIAGIAANPKVRESKFRQAKLRFIGKLIGRKN